MTFDPNNVFSLGAMQRRIYWIIARQVARSGAPAKFMDIRKALSHERSVYIQHAIERLVSKGYVRQVHGEGWLNLNPPHAYVLKELCEAHNINVEDLRGPERSLRMQRLRRVFARRMHRSFNYSFTALGLILNRHRSTVEVFCKPEQRLRRSARRTAAYRASVAAKQAEARV